MVVIRLERRGKTNGPFYRIVAVDKIRKMSGKPLEILGFYEPSTKEVKIDKSKVDAWVKKGAKISLAVKKLISKK